MSATARSTRCCKLRWLRNRRSSVRDLRHICSTSEGSERVFLRVPSKGSWKSGPPPTHARRPEKICPDVQRIGWATPLDVQRKCVPTSKGKLPRRPEKNVPDVQRDRPVRTIVFRDTFVDSLWTSGHISFGRRGTFSLDVGAHFLWTSGVVPHPSSLDVGHMSRRVRRKFSAEVEGRLPILFAGRRAARRSQNPLDVGGILKRVPPIFACAC